jgi:dTDP-4-dehydrorhamnose 3,5-epimerase
MKIRSLLALPAGVVLLNLERQEDGRGSLVEVFRNEWSTGIAPVQWNYVNSAANVLRGVHLHLVHSDYLVILEGSMLVGLADFRKHSETSGFSTIVTLSQIGTNAILIPPGVAHGFYFSEQSHHIYGVSHVWDLADELGCQWNDPGLKLDWPCTSPMLSKRDASLPSLEHLLRAASDEL